MAPEEPTLSPEAQARKRIDELEARLADATKALGDVTIHSRLVQTFASQGHKNAFDLATRAQSQFQDATPDTSADELATRAVRWYETERGLFATGEAEVTPVNQPSQPPTPLSQTQPNLSAPGLQPANVPVVVGSKEYYEQGWAQRSDAEQVAAMRGPNPELVVPDKVRTQQQDNFLRT